MKENDKIHVSEYLNSLNEQVKHAITYHKINKEYVKPLTCKDLAELCEVTPATISNITTSSRFCLLYKVAEEILNAYYGFFMYDEAKEREENPDTLIYPRDKNYVLMCLTSYYTDEFMDY